MVSIHSTFKKGNFNHYPVPDCSRGGKDKFGMYHNFCWQHPEDLLITVEDGQLEKVKLCGMYATDMEGYMK